MTTSELTISEESLTFARTVPGKPVFLVLRLATDEKAVPVTASTDLPAVFQLASDDRPIFGSALSLVSGPAGTYIHIRYQPDRAGAHEATLILQSAVGTRTVTLTGRCARIAAAHTNSNKVLTRTVASREAGSVTGHTGMLLAGVVVVVALLYTGVTYRCQLLPSLCQPDATASSPAVVSSAPSVVEVPTLTPVPERVATVKPAAERTATKGITRNRSERARANGVNSGGRPVQVTEPAVTAEVKPSSAANQSVTRSSATKSARVAKPQAEPARPTKPAAQTEESELERELNGRTSQNQ